MTSAARPDAAPIVYPEPMRPGHLGPPLIALLGFLAACSSADGPSAATVEDQPAGSTSSTVASGSTTDDAASAAISDLDSTVFGRADITEQGNRLADGRGSLVARRAIDVALDGTPRWVLPATAADGRSRWFVELDDGRTVIVDEDGTTTDETQPPRPEPLAAFTDPLPDGRTVGFGDLGVALVGPTDRYPHGVLGDRIEASAIEVRSAATGSSVRFGPEPPSVIEGISPMLGDVDQDGQPEILVTHSNADVGAWLALWSVEGELLAESEPIGQGNRWRNQMAIGPFGPDGEVEIVDVRTPHLGGTVEYFRLDGDALVRVATQTGFTSHQIGSRNLDLGIAADATGDGLLNVIVPTNDRQMLGVLLRTTNGVQVESLIDLPGRLTSNVAVQAVSDGRLAFAVGTDDRFVRIWPAP